MQSAFSKVMKVSRPVRRAPRSHCLQRDWEAIYTLEGTLSTFQGKVPKTVQQISRNEWTEEWSSSQLHFTIRIMLLKQAIKFADQQTVAKWSCNIINLLHVLEMLLFSSFYPVQIYTVLLYDTTTLLFCCCCLTFHSVCMNMTVIFKERLIG